MQSVILAVLIAGATGSPNDVKRAMDKKLALASQALKTSNGDYYPHEHELDSLLMKKAAEVKKEMVLLSKMVDPTKPKAALTAAKSEVHESTSVRAARYFAMHGMKKVSHMLHEELTDAQSAQLTKEQKALKQEQTDDLTMPEDDDEDNAAYKAQW